MSFVVKDREVGFFNSYILQRIERNKNFCAAITGQTGSGKSYSCLKLGEILDKEFDIRNIVFTPKEFMELVTGKTKKLKRGAVIVWDEQQVSMSNLDYQSIQAKAIVSVFQTFRHMGFVLFVSTPHYSFLNASIRKLFHGTMETLSIDVRKKQVIMKPLLLQVNQRTGNIYFKYLRVKSAEGGLVPLKRMRVGKPSKELLKDYEEKKTKFTNDLNEEVFEDLERAEGKKNTKTLTEKQNQVLKYLLEGKMPEEISGEMGIAKKNVYVHVNLMKKKGIKFTQIKADDKTNKVLRYNIEDYEHLLHNE